MRFLIGPGHNAHYPGASYHGQGEYFLVNSYAHTVVERLSDWFPKDKFELLNVNLITQDPYSLFLKEKVRKINKINPNYYIELHLNAASSLKVDGCEAWVYYGSPADLLARSLVNAGASVLGIPNRGVKTSKNLYVLRKTKCRSIIFELYFLSFENAKQYFWTDFDQVVAWIFRRALLEVKR